MLNKEEGKNIAYVREIIVTNFPNMQVFNKIKESIGLEKNYPPKP